MATKQIQYTPPVIESKADPALAQQLQTLHQLIFDRLGNHFTAIGNRQLNNGLTESNARHCGGKEMITLRSNTPILDVGSRSGVSPVGTTSPNSGATAATNSTYGVGAFTSGISEQASASYVLQNTDYQGIIIFDSGATVNVTLNSNVTPIFRRPSSTSAPAQSLWRPATDRQSTTAHRA